jgi:hypothetical protein
MSDEAPESLYERAAIPQKVVVAGRILVFAGLFAGLALVQAVVLLSPAVRIPVSIFVFLAMLGAAALSALATGWSYGRARPWSLRAALPVSIAVALAVPLWFGWAFLHAMFSLMALIALLPAAMAVPFVATSRAEARACAEARARLMESGIEMG